MQRRTLLLTGATGFVGGAAHTALVAAGWQVRCLTRDATRARKHHPAFEWVQGDVGELESCTGALEGCEAALYLVHGIGEGADYHRLELITASVFGQAAAAAGVQRIVYLGGVAPEGPGSEHLRSRLDVGEALRGGVVPTIELRASMIVGHGSLSWLIVRDLSARLPFMVLPRWLKSRTQPVAIDDVVVGLVRALDLPLGKSVWFDIPGPEILSGQEILEETARVMGLGRPRMVRVSVLSPRLSSHWVRFVTRARWSVAREVVVGLTEDLLAKDESFWQLVGHEARLPFSEGVKRALAAERVTGPVRGVWGSIERARGVPKRADGKDVGDEAAPATWLAAASIGIWFLAAFSAGRLGIWAALGGAAGVLGLAVLALETGLASALLKPTTPRVLVGLFTGGAMAAVTYLLYPPLSTWVPYIAADTARLYAAFRAPAPIIAALALVPVIVGEELVWRGLIQTSLVRHMGSFRGVVAAAATYAVAHASLGSPVLIAAALLCGLAWGILRALSASLIPTLVAHLLWDVIVMLWLPLDTR